MNCLFADAAISCELTYKIFDQSVALVVTNSFVQRVRPPASGLDVPGPNNIALKSV